jgi:hypothetical protein
MEQGQELVDLFLRIVPILREAALEEVAEDDIALLCLGRDRSQAAVADERPEDPDLVGRPPCDAIRPPGGVEIGPWCRRIRPRHRVDTPPRGIGRSTA